MKPGPAVAAKGDESGAGMIHEGLASCIVVGTRGVLCA